MDFSNNSEWDINSLITHTLTHQQTRPLTRPHQSSPSDQAKSPSASGSDPDTGASRRSRNSIAKGKITKRKSRASTRNTTTFITADPANFRRMVQQVTGFSVGNWQVPVAPLLKPEPQRLFNRVPGSWPTLDTSASVVGHQYQQQGVGPALSGYAPVTDMDGVGGAGGFSFESISSFPTL